jgi:hypothetical protein
LRIRSTVAGQSLVSVLNDFVDQGPFFHELKVVRQALRVQLLEESVNHFENSLIQLLNQISVVILPGKRILDTPRASEAVLINLAHLDRFIAILA